MKSAQFFALALTGSCATNAVGDAAQHVRDLSQKVREQIESSITFGAGIENLRQELCALFEETSVPGWDGYGAKPVTLGTYRIAYSFLEALPLGMELPTVGAEPGGHLEFEWYRSPNRLISVTVTEDGELHFASIIGQDRDHGMRIFCGAIPRQICQLIRDVCVA